MSALSCFAPGTKPTEVGSVSIEAAEMQSLKPSRAAREGEFALCHWVLTGEMQAPTPAGQDWRQCSLVKGKHWNSSVLISFMFPTVIPLRGSLLVCLGLQCGPRLPVKPAWRIPPLLVVILSVATTASAYVEECDVQRVIMHSLLLLMLKLRVWLSVSFWKISHLPVFAFYLMSFCHLF